MRTPEYAQQEMKSTPRELPGAPAASPEHRRFDESTALSKMTRGSSVWVIDFFETRDRSTEGFEESDEESEINRGARKVSAGGLPAVKGGDRLKESLYWLFTAALLVYVLLEIIGR